MTPFCNTIMMQKFNWGAHKYVPQPQCRFKCCHSNHRPPTEQQDLTARLRGFTEGWVEFAQECANVLDPQTALGLSYTNNTKNPPTNFNDGHDSLERPREEDLEGPEFSQGSTVNHGSCMHWFAFGDVLSGCALCGTPNLDFE